MAHRAKLFGLVAGASLLALSACGNNEAAPEGTAEAPATVETEAPEAGAPMLETSFGPVSGTTEDGIYVFKGVRYGADTATTRFAAPADPSPWGEARMATEYGDTCPQPRGGNPGGLFTSWQPDPEPEVSEDCLFLNVWTPGIQDGGERAIMVWFHGGGFTTGTGSSTGYVGTNLANRGDVVVVTVNHRLNIFGYANLAHYGEEFKDSSVAGVLDMIQALEWVRDNAEAIGGDADNVMIFGESGGGAKVSTLLSSELAKGLFHRAVAQSGVLPVFPTVERSQGLADQMVDNLNLTEENIADIKTMSVAEIQAAGMRIGVGSAPSMDGRVLTVDPFFPEVAASAADVPLMLGTNRTENALFAGAANPAVFDLDFETLPGALSRALPEQDVEAVIAGYRELQPEADAADIYFEATTDARYLEGHVQVAEKKVEQGGAPTYLYLFNWDTPVDGGKWRSPHALEIGFVFDNVERSASIGGVGEEQQQIADMMAETWIAFAKTGNPNNALIPEWPAYNLDNRPMMVFDTTPEAVDDARGAQRALFQGSAAAAYLGRYKR